MRDKEKIYTKLEVYLKGLCEIIGERGKVEIKEGPDNNLNINLKGVVTFSGKDQDILKSLAYLLELYVKRECDEDIRIFVDVNSYKAKRKEKLSRLAKEVAKEVKKERKRIRLNPMKAYERKAIHVALADYPGVKTKSVGEGKQRRVIIEPAHEHKASSR